jgi:hypothetical protein
LSPIADGGEQALADVTIQSASRNGGHDADFVA